MKSSTGEIDMTQEKLNRSILEDPTLDIKKLQEQIVEEIRAGKSLLGQGGLLTPLIKSALEAALEGEMDAYLSCLPEGQANRRNGKLKKQVRHSSGTFELETPRDRRGDFEPQLVKKRQTILNEALDEKILGLFSLGMSYEDIQRHLSEMYDVNLATGTISAVTDKLLPLITQWRNRPLESVYPILFLDAMWFKTRE
jgi:putative transposase